MNIAETYLARHTYILFSFRLIAAPTTLEGIMYASIGSIPYVTAPYPNYENESDAQLLGVCRYMGTSALPNTSQGFLLALCDLLRLGIPLVRTQTIFKYDN